MKIFKKNKPFNKGMKTRGIFGVLMAIFLIGFLSAQTPVLNFSENFANGIPGNSVMKGFATSPLNNGLNPANVTNQWKTINNKLEFSDYGNKIGGASIFIFNKTYSGKDNYTFSADVFRDFTGENPASASSDHIGLIFGYNDLDSSYYEFSTSTTQGWFLKDGGKSPASYCHSDCFNFDGINLSEEKHFQVSVYENKVILSINRKIVKELNMKIPDGKIGFYMWDSSGQYDPEWAGKTYFSNVEVYTSPILEDVTPKDNATINASDSVNYTLKINSTEPVKNATLVENQTFSNGTSISNETTITFPDNTTLTEVTIEKKYSDNVVVEWFWRVVDWFGNVFKTEDKNLTIENGK